jgi:hypothetical protein
MSKFFQSILSGLVVFLLTACTSSVQQMTAGYQYHGEKFNTATITVIPELTERLQGTDFSVDEMTDALMRKLRNQQLTDADAVYSLQVHIDDIRIRSLMNAMLFAFMAGDDHIKGNVAILDANQNTVATFRVSTSFAMGGVFNSQGDVRWEWLYNTFAQQVIAGILQDGSASP